MLWSPRESHSIVLRVALRRWIVLWPPTRLLVVVVLLLGRAFAPGALLLGPIVGAVFGIGTSLWVVAFVTALAFADELVIRNERTLLQNAGLPAYAIARWIILLTAAADVTLVVGAGLVRRILT